MSQESYEIRLATRITTSIERYRELSEDCWRVFDMAGATRWRAMADGLVEARNHQLTVAREMRHERDMAEPEADHG